MRDLDALDIYLSNKSNKKKKNIIGAKQLFISQKELFSGYILNMLTGYLHHLGEMTLDEVHSV